MRALMLERYRQQVEGLPRLEFTTATKAKHFVMLDDQDFFFAAIDSFLRKHR